jgi:cytochrome oxidase Cu insertion factor (SCO1/SenC/PrrC family)
MKNERSRDAVVCVPTFWIGCIIAAGWLVLLSGCVCNREFSEKNNDFCCSVRPDVRQYQSGSLLVQAVLEEERKVEALAGCGFVDMHGNRIAGQDLVGKPTALSFIYTRCENPARCPTITKAMIGLQHRIENSHLVGRINVGLVSFDPTFDTPGVLAAYAEAYEIQKDSGLLLMTPDVQLKTDFFERIKMPVNYELSGRPNGHGTLLLLLDKRGRVAERHEVVFGDVDLIFQSLERLAKEQYPLSVESARIESHRQQPETSFERR